MPRTKRQTNAILKKLRAFGLSYPGAHLKSPWPNHADLAVKDKTFCYLPPDGKPLSLSCKLPHSCEVALMLPFVKPTGYGLGKSGWVSASFDADTAVDIEMLEAWIDESYRAQAPKRLIKELDAGGAAAKKVSAKSKASKKKAATKKRTTKKTAKKAPAKKRATKKKAPAKKRATKKKAPAKKRATKKRTTRKRTAKKQASAKKRTTKKRRTR